MTLLETFISIIISELIKAMVPIVAQQIEKPVTLIQSAPDPELSHVINQTIDQAIAAGALPGSLPGN